MAFTESQIAWLRSKVGTDDPPSDDDLQEIFDRIQSDGVLTEDLDILSAVATEVLETRLATLRNSPDSFSIAGEYSQSTKDQMKAVQDALTGVGAGGVAPTVRIRRAIFPCR